MYNAKELSPEVKGVLNKIQVSKAEGLNMWHARPDLSLLEHMPSIRENVGLTKAEGGKDQIVNYAWGGFPFLGGDGGDGSTREDLSEPLSKKAQRGAGITAWILGGVVGLGLTAMFAKMVYNWGVATLAWIAGAGSHVFALYLLGVIAVPVLAAVLIKIASGWGKRNRG